MNRMWQLTSELKAKVRNLVETMYGFENLCQDEDIARNQHLVCDLKDRLGFCYKVSVDVVCYVEPMHLCRPCYTVSGQ